MALHSMQHWNGDQMCVVDIETTGLNPHWHEMIQICILPLTSAITPRKDVYPFYIQIIPENPERADREAMNVNRQDFAKIALTGHSADKARDLFMEWTDKLSLPYNKYGSAKKKIIPLGQNYAFDVQFIKEWLGPLMYDEYFSPIYRDTMATAAYLNDRAAAHVEKVPYSKYNLRWLATTLKVTYAEASAHDALQDCIVTAEVYRRMINHGLLG